MMIKTPICKAKFFDKFSEKQTFPNEITDFTRQLDLYLCLKQISINQVLESLSKARDKLLEIGFDQQDLEQFEVSFFDNKIKDLAKVYSGYKLE